MLNPPPGELRELLRSCLKVERWVDDVAGAAPFPSLTDLLEAADAAGPLERDEIAEAMADHPRIGENRTDASAAAEFSRREQSSLGDDDESTVLAIADGNAQYEARFDRVFLIRAAGRTRTEILSELQRRLALDDETELAIVGSELLAIARLRLQSVYQEYAS